MDAETAPGSLIIDSIEPQPAQREGETGALKVMNSQAFKFDGSRYPCPVDVAVASIGICTS
jgi:hypothetical protein